MRIDALISLLSVPTLLAVGEVPALGNLGPILQFGAMAPFCWFVYLMFGELRANRDDRAKERKEQCETIGKLADSLDRNTEVMIGIKEKIS